MQQRLVSHSPRVALAAALVGSLFASTAEAQPIVRREGARLRLGLEAGGGGAWGTPRGPAIGVLGQLGVQFNDLLAVYYQPSLYVHSIGNSDGADAFTAMGNLAMLDLTFGMFQIGAGGGFDVGRFADCSNDPCVGGDLTLSPAIGGRAALVLGLGRGYSRWGIPFALNVHSTFLDSPSRVTSVLLTVGIQRF